MFAPLTPDRVLVLVIVVLGIVVGIILRRKR